MLASLLAGSASGASSRTIPLRWVERHSAYGRHFVMTFTVRSITIDRGRWSARISLTNRTNLYVRVANRFALVAERPTGERVILKATRFEPRVPVVLGFLQRWVGTAGGTGVPPRGTRLRLRFAEFRVDIAPNLVIRHVTRHSLRW